MKLFGKNKTKELEESIPELLYRVSSEYQSFEELVNSIAEDSEGAVKEEFALACSEIRKGKSFQGAMRGIASRNPSESLEKTVDLIVTAYETGGESSEFLRETADELVRMRELENEQAAGLAIERYTIILASALIIPLVLGILSGVINDLSGALPDGLSSTTPEQRAEFRSYSFWASESYLLIMGMMSGAFIAYQANSPGKKYAYATALSICSLAVFNSLVLL